MSGHPYHSKQMNDLANKVVEKQSSCLVKVQIPLINILNYHCQTYILNKYQDHLRVFCVIKDVNVFKKYNNNSNERKLKDID